MTDATAMTFDDAVRAMASASVSGDGTPPPLEAMRWSLDNWDAAAPRFVAMLSRYADGIERSPDIENALLYIVHMLGEKSETAAFAPLCKLLRDDAATEAAIGESVIMTLKNIMISTFDGNLATLRGVIEDPNANEYARCQAFGVMAWLTRTGRIPREETRAYMRQLLATMQPDHESSAWLGWTDVVWLLGFDEFAADVQRLYEDGLVALVFRGHDGFARDLQRTLDDPESMAGFEELELGPFRDAIGEVARWFSRRKSDPADGTAPLPSLAAELAGQDGGTYRNPLRHVGRNDPCPCGSGKKFKKCCLGKADAVALAEAM